MSPSPGEQLTKRATGRGAALGLGGLAGAVAICLAAFALIAWRAWAALPIVVYQVRKSSLFVVFNIEFVDRVVHIC